MKLGFPIATFFVLSACTDFTDVTRGVCGNGVLEAGEDCDSDSATCVRCAVTCTAAAECPTAEYTCGVDGLCHSPGGVLAEPTSPVTFGADDLRITDIDRDGTGDVLGVSKTSIIVRHGDAKGSLTSVSSFVTPAQSGPPAFGDLDGDGSIDVTLSTLDGIVSYTSKFGTLSPVDIEAPIRDDGGDPLNILMLFAVGQFQLGAFIVDQSGIVVLVVVDLLNPTAPYAVVPCGGRLGTITSAHFAQPTVDIYRASGDNAVTADFVVSFLTDTGAPCSNSIHGNTLAGFTFADITPAGANGMQHKPILADLDTDADPCPSMVNSDGGGAALHAWEGHMTGGHCVFDPAGVDGAALGPVPGAPSSAVAIGRIPISPVIPGVASDALVLTSGVEGYVPSSNAFAEIYNSSSRKLAYVATGDLDGDGDIDAVLATADEDDLDVLYRFPLGLQLLRLDTASQVTSLTIADFDGNSVNDIAYTETTADHQNLMISYGTTDRPLEPVQVATFSSVGSVIPLGFPDSVDTLSIAEDLAVIQPGAPGTTPTMTLLHGSPQRTMLSFFDPRSDADPEKLRQNTVLRGAVIGDFTERTVAHRDLLAIGTPNQGQPVGMRAWRAAGTDAGLDSTPSLGMAANGLADCDGTGVCVRDAFYLAWPLEPGHDVVIAVDRQDPARAALLDPWSSAGLGKTEIPMLLQNVPAGATVHSMYASDLDGDGTLELVASFATHTGALTGSARVCKMANGVPQKCDELTPIVKADQPNVTACIDAAPGRIALADPTTPVNLGRDLVVLCVEGGSTTTLFRVVSDATGYHATPLAQSIGLRAIRVDDVTGDGVDDVIAVQGSAGSQSLVVFAQCSSRDVGTCRQAAAAMGGAP